MNGDCDHGPDRDTCPVCNPAPDPDPWDDLLETPSRPSRPTPRAGWFAARYRSRCNWCDETIEPGDTAFMRDGHAVCEECGK